MPGQGRTVSRRGAVLIAGPTASGKSAVGLGLAREIGGLVVNADSMQVYRDLRILTARPTAEEEASAPHRLFGHVDGAVNYSVGRYVADVAEVLAEADESGATPIFVGGTGLYFKALTEGLSELPAVPAAVRERVRDAAEGRPTPDLHRELAARDPATAATLRPSDRQRVLRALEIHAATGASLVGLRGHRGPALLAGRVLTAVFLSPDRAALRDRIDARFADMIAAGALDEVAALGRRGLDPALPVMRAHGVPALLRHLAGLVPLDEAVARGQADTRAYAKRQVTWFRHQMPAFRPVAPESAPEEVARGIAAGPAVSGDRP